ncbi:ribosome biogenesis GTP-binding protein YihA/YsxC [Desulfomonile tiedjei]|uniref:Probable GTP-binding protein EngB n=1 Tax=Desulfomonile tiedjei (strain ATCC 49306 / DSM 6799 / DCB-1) TaxID=706587 RepID=I4C733_DESTA|nr:ribosome biogenesis GTP-binding protein YihA/YsxC [Desulfomonile tiedjei]AFM25374.1 ribosome biogenesis GTP-binding protein YsxC/EngB [Desulfomonile tiedjei DSM 6799]
MKVSTAEFFRAAEEKKDYPPGEYSELAFAGRSNVGKSSMINTLLGRRNLVRTSKTPGHTRKLNFYLINGRLYFVDLPGYGFAKVPLEVREKWRPMVETYLTGRRQLAGVVVIVDARRPPTESDMSLIEFLQAYDKPLIVAATKADKLTRNQMAEQKRTIRSAIQMDVPIVFFSALNGLGKNELWKEIKKIIE